MATAAIKATAYCLNYAAELGQRYGTTPYMEREAHPDSPLADELACAAKDYAFACRYAPHLTYIGAMSTDELTEHPRPWLENPAAEPRRFGRFGEIMPEDEFLGLMDICDVFDLIWLEKTFAARVREKLAAHPLMGETQLKRLEEGRDEAALKAEAAHNHALPLYFEGKLAGVCRRGHEADPNLSAHVLLENLASKAGAVLALMHLVKNSGLSPVDIDFVIDCSEEAAGDINQRGGGNMAKAIAESAGCASASGFDLRAFCAAPVAAVITAASLVAAGAHKNVAVVSGGSVPKLYMNGREHLKKNIPPMENCLGCFAVLITPDKGEGAVIRLDCLGKHSVAAGASPQAITTALVWEPLQAAGLQFEDIDKYAPELHDPEVTVPAGAGNVPEANFKMIAALSVMKGQLDKAEIANFVARRGLPGFAPTQGHIPSGVPYLGHALVALEAEKIRRAMIIGKGSLFLGRLTNLADGASFIIEKARPTAISQAVSRQEVESVILDVLGDLASKLKE